MLIRPVRLQLMRMNQSLQASLLFHCEMKRLRLEMHYYLQRAHASQGSGKTTISAVSRKQSQVCW
jgi:hypothetical protein